MKALKARCCIIFILMAVAISPARADYHYASHEGANLWPYTSWETAADSIKFAINAAAPGDTVFIGAGEWKERVVAAEEDSNLAVIGAGMDSTYWWWDVWGQFALWSGPNMLIKHIHFSHTRTGTINSGNYRSIRVENCLLTRLGAYYCGGAPKS
jgi:hypothetical protein